MPASLRGGQDPRTGRYECDIGSWKWLKNHRRGMLQMRNKVAEQVCRAEANVARLESSARRVARELDEAIAVLRERRADLDEQYVRKRRLDGDGVVVFGQPTRGQHGGAADRASSAGTAYGRIRDWEAASSISSRNRSRAAKAESAAAIPAEPMPQRDVPFFIQEAHEVNPGNELDYDWTLRPHDRDKEMRLVRLHVSF